MASYSKARSLAELAYMAYAEFTGQSRTLWDSLDDAERGGWGMAVEAVIREVHQTNILPETLTGVSDDIPEEDADIIEEKGPPDGGR